MKSLTTLLIVLIISITVGLISFMTLFVIKDQNKNTAIQDCFNNSTYTTTTQDSKAKTEVRGILWDAYTVCLKDKGFSTTYTAPVIVK